jgi:hypothetical protein
MSGYATPTEYREDWQFSAGDGEHYHDVVGL